MKKRNFTPRAGASRGDGSDRMNPSPEIVEVGNNIVGFPAGDVVSRAPLDTGAVGCDSANLGRRRSAGSVRRNAESEEAKHLARVQASHMAAFLIKKMRKGANLTVTELAVDKLKMANASHLSDIERVRRRINPKTGKIVLTKVPLELLYEVADATGYELELNFVRKGFGSGSHR